MSLPVHVIVAEADPLTSEGLARSLSHEPGLIGRAAVGPLAEALECCRQARPSVLLVQHDLLIEQLDFGRSVSALALGSEPDSEIALRCLRLGCMGYLSRRVSLATLVKAIRTVVAGEIWAPRRIVTSFVREMVEGGRRLPRLSQREREILGLIHRGASNADISDQLCVSPETVRWHVRRLFVKIGVHDRNAAAEFARRWLYFIASPGKAVGKNHLACAFLR